MRESATIGSTHFWLPLVRLTASLFKKQTDPYAHCVFCASSAQSTLWTLFPKTSKKSHHMTWPRACSTEEPGISMTGLSDGICHFPSFQITAFVCCRLKLPLLVPRTLHLNRHSPPLPPSIPAPPNAIHGRKSGKAIDSLLQSKA